MKKCYWILGVAILIVLGGFIILCRINKANDSDGKKWKEYGEVERKTRNISVEKKEKDCSRSEYSATGNSIIIHHDFLNNIRAFVEQEIPYVDEEVFEMIKLAYSEIDYLAEFEWGNQEIYDEYLQKFWHLLQSDVAFWDRKLNKEVLIKEWEEVYGGYAFELKKSKYYFFDMNGDGLPELCIDPVEPVVVFAYDLEKDQYTLWAWLGAKNIVGTRKVILHPEYESIICDFLQLSQHGDYEIETLFWAEIHNGLLEDINVVMFPNYLDQEKDWVITEEMKQQGIFEESSGQWFFRITDEQFEELKKPYMEAYYLALDRLRNNAYTYDELFGRFEAE